MDRGGITLLWILGAAVVLGVAVIAAHPAFRQTASAMWRGRIENSPIWISNRDYYPQVRYGDDVRNELAE